MNIRSNDSLAVLRFLKDNVFKMRMCNTELMMGCSTMEIDKVLNYLTGYCAEATQTSIIPKETVFKKVILTLSAVFKLTNARGVFKDSLSYGLEQKVIEWFIYWEHNPMPTERRVTREEYICIRDLIDSTIFYKSNEQTNSKAVVGELEIHHFGTTVMQGKKVTKILMRSPKLEKSIRLEVTDGGGVNYRITCDNYPYSSFLTKLMEVTHYVLH